MFLQRGVLQPRKEAAINFGCPPVYHSSPKKYEIATGKTFTTHCPCIHRTGSVKGMVKLKFWDKDSDKVRHGDFIYKQPS